LTAESAARETKILENCIVSVYVSSECSLGW
jgi:hypothetical protein